MCRLAKWAPQCTLLQPHTYEQSVSNQPREQLKVTYPKPVQVHRRDPVSVVGNSLSKRLLENPIDYSAWKDLSADEINDETLLGAPQINGSSNRPEIYTRIGDFTGEQIDQAVLIEQLHLPLIHLAKTTSPEARAQSMPAQTIEFDFSAIAIHYRPRDRAVELPTYEVIVKGSAFIGRQWKEEDDYRLCSFVIFHNDNPIVDGIITRV